MPYPYPPEIKASRVMVFVDGENLAIRYASLLGNAEPFKHVQFERNTYVWSPLLDLSSHRMVNTVTVKAQPLKASQHLPSQAG